jgi:hypothetical protein
VLSVRPDQPSGYASSTLRPRRSAGRHVNPFSVPMVGPIIVPNVLLTWAFASLFRRRERVELELQLDVGSGAAGGSMVVGGRFV